MTAPHAPHEPPTASGGRPYLDVHAHLGDTVCRVPPVGQSAEKFLARMADSAVSAALPCPAGGGAQARGVLDTRDQNEAVAAACRRWPERFPLGLGIVEVRHLAAAVEELDRSMAEAGLAGFMIHPGLSGHQMGAELWPFLEVTDARDGLVLLHVSGGGHEARVAEHARRFRRTRFIMAHVTSRPGQQRAAVEAFAGLENVWCDVAQQTPADDRALPELLAGVGTERVLYGSDAPYYDYRRLQALIERSSLDEATKDRVAWRNAEALIRLFRPDWRLPPAPPEPPAALAGVDLWAEQPGQPGRLL